MVKQYILSLLTAAIICSIINDLMEKKGTPGMLIKMISGLFLSVVMLSPLVKVNVWDMDRSFEWIRTDAHAAVASGQQMAQDSLAGIIKEQTETYILDKAAYWELDLAVEVTLSETDPPVPRSVMLKGAASPYAKKQMTQWITTQLGISEEQQEWN